MGCPASGSILFVYPIQSQSRTVLLNGNNSLHGATLNSLSTYNPSELYLELIPSKNCLTINNTMLSPVKCSTIAYSDGFENGSVSSPRTPLLHQPKLSSPASCQFTSTICEESVSNLPDRNIASFGSADIREVLGDERAKKLLQSCSSSWLCSRKLLCGNLVAIPILSELCIFCVRGANKLSVDGSECPSIGKSHGISPQTCISDDYINAVFVINLETKVNLFLSRNSLCGTPHKGELECIEAESRNVNANVKADVPKLGGLSSEYEVLMDIISSSVKDTLSSLGLRTTKGVLLHGPSGTGKTTLVRLCARDAGINLFSINGPELISQYYGESEKALHEVFDSASQAPPAVVFIDELDAIAPARNDVGDGISLRMVAALLNLMDGISENDGLLVIGTTNRPGSIDPALRRPGRFDRQIEIGVLSPVQRSDILHTLLGELDHCLSDPQVRQLAMGTHGFVGADLSALCNVAALICLRRHIKLKKSCVDLHSRGSSVSCDGCSDGKIGVSDCPKDIEDQVSLNHSDCASSYTSDVPDSSFSFTGTASKGADNTQNGVRFSFERAGTTEECTFRVDFEDFEKARTKVRPSAMRGVILEVPKVNWEDVGGQKEVKTQLMEAVVWPQKHQDALKRIGTQPPTGVLMFGPPGCSKTLMARAVASEAGMNFFSVKGPELFNKWVGESEKAVKSLFARARANAPSIIFFDEIDSLAVIRGKDSVADRVTTQLLVELDGLHQRVDVTVIAATNRPDVIDPAVLRPGRFDRLLYVGPPNETDREDIFRIHLRKTPCSSDVSIRELAHLTDGCTGADIKSICREAAMCALEENLDASEVTMEHFKIAISQVRLSDMQFYQEVAAKFQRLVVSCSVTEELSKPCHQIRLNWTSFWTSLKSATLFLNKICCKRGPSTQGTIKSTKMISRQNQISS
ncbi:calmodulin-interacting protein 111 isoform X2 [Malania oleifera]|nr:calmodulin-interacting protein 111 isoform X2 [Malania oleifera]